MAKYVVKELPKEMTDGKKVLFPKMRTYTQHAFIVSTSASKTPRMVPSLKLPP